MDNGALQRYYRPAVVDACIKTIFLGILDLSLRGYSMELDFPNFAKVTDSSGRWRWIPKYR